MMRMVVACALWGAAEFGAGDLCEDECRMRSADAAVSCEERSSYEGERLQCLDAADASLALCLRLCED